jgi:hypothetical protein
LNARVNARWSENPEALALVGDWIAERTAGKAAKGTTNARKHAPAVRAAQQPPERLRAR